VLEYIDGGCVVPNSAHVLLRGISLALDLDCRDWLRTENHRSPRDSLVLLRASFHYLPPLAAVDERGASASTPTTA